MAVLVFSKLAFRLSQPHTVGSIFSKFVLHVRLNTAHGDLIFSKTCASKTPRVVSIFQSRRFATYYAYNNFTFFKTRRFATYYACNNFTFLRAVSLDLRLETAKGHLKILPSLRVSTSHKVVSIFSKPTFCASNGLKFFKAYESKLPMAVSIFQKPALRASDPPFCGFNFSKVGVWRLKNRPYSGFNFFKASVSRLNTAYCALIVFKSQRFVPQNYSR